MRRRIVALFLIFGTGPLLLLGAAVYASLISLLPPGAPPRWTLAVVFVVFLLFVIAIPIVFAQVLRRVLRPLSDLTNAAGRVASGDFTPWLPVLPGNDEIARLTIAFGTMVLRLRELVEKIEGTRPIVVLGQFLGHLAHEMRNPLCTVRLNLQRLERGLRDGRVAKELKEPVQLCLLEVARLENVVQESLSIGRDRNGRDIFRLRDPIFEAASLLAAEAARRGISFDIDWGVADDSVLGNPHAIHGAFLNLVRNAMDAIARDGTIRIRSTATRAAGNPVIRVEVHDDGPGVPPELRERIFEPYFTTKPSGVGLGLVLARATIESHGGRLYLEHRSEVQKGTTFVVNVPRHVAVAAAPALQEAAI
jgi:signal transduction histidine kinase